MTPALLSPLRLRELELPNRIVVSPMCQYSAVDGCATDWHLVHLGQYAVSGVGLTIIEATHVERRGRISRGCMGLYPDENEAALVRVVDFYRRHGNARLGVQMAHSGRKGSTRRPWERRGEPLPAGEDDVAHGGAVGAALRRGLAAACRARCRRPGDRARRLRAGHPARGAPGPGPDRDPQRPRLPAAQLPVAAEQPARRCLRRQPGQPHALPARGVRRRARRVARRAPAGRAHLGYRLGRRRLDGRGVGRVRPRAEGARLRLHHRLQRRRLAEAAGSRSARATSCRWPPRCAKPRACR